MPGLQAPHAVFDGPSAAVVETMLKLGEVQKGDILYDLGCGDGRIVVLAAQKFGIARGTGIGIDPGRIKEAQENARHGGATKRRWYSRIIPASPDGRLTRGSDSK